MVESPEAPPSSSSQGGIIRAARLLSIGNIASRMLGLVSTAVMSNLFGAELVAAYEKAAWIPLNLRDLIIGGMVDSALVPVFSELAAEEQRDFLWRSVSTFLSIATVVLIVLIAIVELLYRPIAWSVGIYEFDDPLLTETSLMMMRLATPAVLFLSIASILTSVLYALKRFAAPAFVTAIFNATIIVFALAWPDNVLALVYGLLVGAFLQILIQLPELRDARIHWNFNINHPVVRRIIKLYLPIVGGLFINTAVVALSFNLATRTGDASQTYMRNAVRLIQFPMGLVALAVSVASLPTLSQQAGVQADEFKQTLSSGIKLVLVLILPATFGLFVLAHPIIALLFGHGAYTPADVRETALVLQAYLFGLPFAAVDLLLVYAAYAQKDTLGPATIGVVSMLVNAAVAVSLLNVIGLFSLMAADVVRHLVHTALMIWLLRRHIGSLRDYQIGRTTAKALVAALATGVASYFVAQSVAAALAPGTLGELIIVMTAGGAGLAVYALCIIVLDIKEARLLLRRGLP